MHSLLQTPVIPHQTDLLWAELPSGWQGPKQLILLCRPQAENDPAIQMLHELAQKACGFAEGTYALLELPEGNIVPWSKIKNEFQPAYVLLFGIQPAELGIQARFLFNQPNHFSDAVFVPTYDAGALSENKQLKTELWVQALKGIFQK